MFLRIIKVVEYIKILKNKKLCQITCDHRIEILGAMSKF